MNPEDIAQLVQGRIEQAVESLEDAKTLLATGRSGRSIVNRSYYSMFYCVLALLQTINRVPRKHQGAVSLFDREFVHRGLLPKDLSADLHRVFELREVDDYKRLGPVSLDEAKEALTAAENFLVAVRQHLAEAGQLPRE
ncbi:MAG: HEPN domain-containing protein [Deltaproteobacteria bacterium]|nr:HEPN domain-containing protein [Deltaproteobacteria bacterium]